MTSTVIASVNFVKRALPVDSGSIQALRVINGQENLRRDHMNVRACLPFCAGLAVLSLIGGACSSAESDGRTVVDGQMTTGKVAEPLGTQATVMTWPGGHNFAETATVALVGSSGLSETLVTANSATTSGGPDTTFMFYGCTNDNYQTWTTYQLSGLLGNGSDVSVIYRDQNATRRAYMALAFADGTGIRVFFTADPCPNQLGALWSWVDISLDPTGSIDFPKLVYDHLRDVVWLTWTKRISNPLGGTTRRMYAGALASDLSSISYWRNDCSNIASRDVNFVSSVFDSTGLLHLSYADLVTSVIRHETWDPATNTFGCVNSLIGPWAHPNNPNPCPSCSVPTYTGLQSNCLRSNDFMSSISVGGNPFGGTSLVVAYSTPGSGSCVSDSETRFYLSLDGGSNWLWQAVTGCQNSIQPVAKGVSSSFHVMSSYVPGGDNRLAQVDWVSRDGGQTWGGTYMTGVRDTLGPIQASSCYWGDYNAAAFDANHTTMFYSWGMQRSPTWTAEGITNNP